MRTALAVVAALVTVAAGTAARTAPGAASDRPRPRIVGGDEAPPGAWPQVAALLDSSVANPWGAQLCGATILNRSWVLTAAHCLQRRPGDEGPVTAAAFDVLTGTQDLGSGGQRLRAAELRVMPSFGGGVASASDDVAVVRLDDPTPIGATTVLPASDGVPAPGTAAVAVGWGDTTVGQGSYPVKLRQVSVPIVSDADCAASYPSAPNRFDAASMLCAGDLALGGKDTCSGDSGGPLFVPGAAPGQWVQVGVTSWGSSCAQPGFPGVYARLPALADWVRAQVRFGPFSSAPAFVRQQYADLFGRAPSDVELWQAVAGTAGDQPAAYVTGLLSERAWQGRAGGIARLYRAMLLRDADTGGLAYWIDRSRSGTSLARIASSFADSPEFRALYGGLDDRAFVARLYANVLQREADPEGIDYWTNEIVTQRRTRGGVVLGISASPEFIEATQARIDVTISFFGLVRRVPTGTELAQWTPSPLADLVSFLLASYSYAARF
ncbi:MAG: trypsin-like serine protease [Actinobacteria bacterium]|nr:trypsin-like serine protease [Actinomycetota bacterium]